MGGGTTISAPAPVTSAADNYKDSLNAYTEMTPQRNAASISDAQTQLQIAQQQLPAILQLNSQYGQQYNQQQIDLEKQMQPQELQLAQQTMAGKIAGAQSQASNLRSMMDDPNTAAVRTALGNQVNQGIQAGSNLTPDMQRQVEQSIRAAQSARGMTQGGSAVSAEAFAKGSMGQQLLQQRQQAANQFLQTQSATQIDPWAAYTGQGTTRTSTVMNAQLPKIQGVDATVNSLSTQQNQANMMNSQLAFNADQFNASNQPKYGQMIGTALGAGVGFAATGGTPMGAAVGGMMGGQAGGSTGF